MSELQAIAVERIGPMSELQQGKVVNLDQVMKKSNRTGKMFPINYVELDNGARINVGFDQPYAVGQVVSIPTEVAYGELQVPRNPPSGGGASAGATVADKESKPTQNRAPYGRNTRFPVPKDHGDVSIMRQNALTNAVSFLTKRLIDEDASTGEVDNLPLDEAIELIIDTAYKFAEFTTGQREERMAKEIMGIKEEGE